MSPSLLEQLPEIIAAGRKLAAHILRNLEAYGGTVLQTREMVMPANGVAAGATQDLETGWTGRLIHGDNLAAMAALLAGDEQMPSLRGKLDLIYIDPPFDSRSDYHMKVALPDPMRPARTTQIRRQAYSDTWRGGTASYLAMLVPRLILMRELLADTGSIYVHLDWHAGHYVKVILDDIMGRQNLRNEIVWCYHGPGSPRMRQFNRKHDHIYWYSKSDAWTFNADDVRMPLSGPLGGGWAGIDRAALAQRGKIPEDWWEMAVAARLRVDGIRRTGYATEKPNALLERIIQASSGPGALVADFFSGSGAFAYNAERLSRNWISVDIGAAACLTARKRLAGHGARPFLYQTVRSHRAPTDQYSSGTRGHRLPQAASRQHLLLHPVERRINSGQETLQVRLKNYVLPSPQANELDADDRSRLHAVADADPLALIEYWAVDPDYDGNVFRSIWQSHRSGPAHAGQALRVSTLAVLRLPRKHGPRQVCIRAVDVLGLETEVVLRAEAPA